jgi:hypothetical protein
VQVPPGAAGAVEQTADPMLSEEMAEEGDHRGIVLAKAAVEQVVALGKAFVDVWGHVLDLRIPIQVVRSLL